jgi:hypothetical protein
MVMHSCILLLGAAIQLAPAGPIEIHVTSESAEAAPGVLVAETVPDALERLDELRDEGDERAAQVLLHDGRHVIAEPLVIDAALVGNGLLLAAAEDAEPMISGGRVIEGLRAHEDGTWRVVIDDVADGAWWFEEVFADVEPRTRARHPNAAYARVVTAGPDNRTSFSFDPDEMPVELIDRRAEVVFLHDWSTSRVRIADVDADEHVIAVAAPIGCKAPHYAITNFERHPRYFIEGSPLLVDAPGEWALDRESGEFIYMPMPGERIDDVQLIAPAASGLIRVAGSPDALIANVELRGIRFAHVNWPIPAYGYAEGQASFYEQRDRPGSDGTRDAIPAAIEMAWAEDCRIDSCAVTAVGGSGIWIGAGSRDCAVTDTIVRDTGANGIMLGEAAGRIVDGGPWWQTAPEQVASNNAVRHSLVERCGRRFFGAVGIWIGLAERTTVAHCAIRELPYTGVSVGWRWDQTPTPCRANRVEGNHIHDVMKTLSDGGGIYTLGRQPGTVLRHNAIHDVRRNAGRAPSNGIFLDQGTTELVVEKNVFWGIDTTPLRWHWTYENIVRNNVFALTESQGIAHYNRAKAEDITYEDNRTIEDDGRVPDAAREIVKQAGVR